MRKLFYSAFLLTLQACSNDAKTHITQSDLLEQMQKPAAPVIIDVRSEREYQAGHIPTALHIQFWNTFTTRQLQTYSSAAICALL